MAKPKVSTSLIDVATQLEREGLLKFPLEVDEKCTVATATLSWRPVARRASQLAGGMWHVQNNGVRWQLGRQSYYLLATGGLDELMRVRNLTQALTGLEPGWSVGSCAGKLLKWSLLPCEPTEHDQQLLAGEYIGYHECAPGLYSHGAHFDIKGCYFQMIGRLKSPRCGIDKNGNIRFYPLLPDERVKWETARKLMQDEKLLRNAVWGSMLGGSGFKKFFTHGEQKSSPPYHGASYAAAALVARSAWEVCNLAATQCEAVYAQTDGIIVTNDRTPTLWDELGLEYRNQYSGNTHILYQHSYKVGDFQTKWYQHDSAFAYATPRRPLPERLYYKDWL